MRNTPRPIAILLLLFTAPPVAACQTPSVQSIEEAALREYTGVYRWQPDRFVYLQVWSELTGKPQLVAFDESGEVRTLFPTARDTFFAGPGAAIATAVESRVHFTRDNDARVTALEWQRAGNAARRAPRVDIERWNDVRFRNGSVELSGTLIRPKTNAKHPAIVLVHASGAEDRGYLLPFARFLIRHGIAVLGYDKRGVGGSTGDWRTASFNDLAGDVLAAVKYLKTRPDIDHAQIGLLGWSQAGWVMPLAAVQDKDIAFLISISGAGIPVAETTLDQARNEMTANGMRPQIVDQIINLMKLQYRFAQTGTGWHDYASARAQLVAQLGRAPENFPGDRDHPQWDALRLLYFYDPEPTLRKLRTPTLALFGELDNNIVAAKNKAAWDAALKSAGNSDYALVTLANANHLMLEARTGHNAEMPGLKRFVPAYFSTIEQWLARRIKGFAKTE